MSKPINVEAQRVAKIISDTQSRLSILALLSHELFVEVKKKSEDELKASFGAEAGKLLFDEANCEDKFQSVNILNGTNMEPLDSQEFLPDQKRSAIINARDIERQILRLVRLFSREDLKLKLHKEFGFLSKTANEIDMFNQQFKELQTLWTTKLCTPLEEVLSVQESLTKLRLSTDNLRSQLRIKEDGFFKFQESAKEQREQRQKELEDLKNQQINKQTDRKTREDDLKSAGDEVKERHKLEHEERKKELQEQIAKLQKKLDEKTNANRDEETKLTAAFESADKMYTEALDTYDTELNNHVNELEECQKEYAERDHELKQLQDEWGHRQEERRKTEEIQAMMEKKEEELQKKNELLSKGAEWIQAHWRGLLERRNAEKARKKGKKKGRKGKK